MNSNCFCELTFLAREQTLRYDSGFIMYETNQSLHDTYCFDDLFRLVSDSKVRNAEDIEELDYVEIGMSNSENDIYPVHINWDEISPDKDSYAIKIRKGDIIKVQVGDILISKVRPYLNKILYITDEYSSCYFTSAFIHIRPLKHNKILFYALKSYFLSDLISIARQGKGYPTVSEKDLSYLRFNKHFIDSLFSHSSELLPKIEHIENEIKQIKSQLKPDIHIINDIFLNKFPIDFSIYNSIKSQKSYTTKFSQCANNIDLRFSAKFHRPSGKFLTQEILKYTSYRLKDFCSEPIILGASVSPSDFDANGDHYYVSMATIKNYSIELDDAQLLSKEYISDPKVQKKNLQQFDIILNRSGEAIGKLAFNENNVNAIFADFTMRIRLKNINSKYVYYFLRSFYFQYLIEIHKKGTQNWNIFPIQIQDFPIIVPTTDIQSKIVKLIDSRIEDAKNKKERMTILFHSIYDLVLNYDKR